METTSFQGIEDDENDEEEDENVADQIVTSQRKESDQSSKHELVAVNRFNSTKNQSINQS